MDQRKAMNGIKNKLSDIEGCFNLINAHIKPELLNESRFLAIMMGLGLAYSSIRNVCELVELVREQKHENGFEKDIWATIEAKIDTLNSELRQELDRVLFPEGREKAVQKLEERIHGMTFQNED